MDSGQTSYLRDLLSGTAWFGECRAFARTLRSAPRTAGGLLLVGTPEEEPWHLAAHLDTEAELAALPLLAPTLVRHRVPAGAPAHLAVGLERLERARKGEALLVIAPDDPGVPLLERADDARRRGAAILTVADDEVRAAANRSDLLALSHDALIVPRAGIVPGFDAAQHLLASAAGEKPAARGSLRDRLTALVDRVTGTPVDVYR